MPDRILTSHAGSLPRPEELIALNGRRGGEERLRFCCPNRRR